MSSKVIALTGAAGMLGRSLARSPGVDWRPLPRSSELDLRDRDSLLKWFSVQQPEIVIHAAAMTAVDRCEEEPERAFEINREGTRHVVEAARLNGARLVYVSTDYVFDGGGDRPWSPEDPTGPINTYGASKLAGEDIVRAELADWVIARVSWLYGPRGPSFLHTMARLGKQRSGSSEPLRVVSDQVGSPTSTLVLAPALVALSCSDVRGIFHLAPKGNVSWFDYAKQIFLSLGLSDLKVEACSSEEFKRPAVRPQNSRLDTVDFDSLQLYDMGTWQDGVEAFARDYREELLA